MSVRSSGPCRRVLAGIGLFVLAGACLFYFLVWRQGDRILSAVASRALGTAAVQFTGVRVQARDRIGFKKVAVSGPNAEPWISAGAGDLRFDYGHWTISGVKMRFSDVKIEPSLSSRVNFSGQFPVDHGEFDVERAKETATMTLMLFSPTGPLLRASWEMALRDLSHGR